MTKSNEELERPRRPAARRVAAARTDTATLPGASASAAERDGHESASSAKRVHARRAASDADAQRGSDDADGRRVGGEAAAALSSSAGGSRSVAVRGARVGRPMGVLSPIDAPSVPPAAADSEFPPARVYAADAQARAPHARLHSDAAAPESATLMVTSAASPSRRPSTALRMRADLVDEFGLDLAYEAKLRPFFEAMSRNYLHVQVIGAQHIPTRGRALLVSNHTRSLAWDGILLRTVLRLQQPAQRELRWLVEDDQFHAPFLGTFVNRLGAVRACQENAERLLQREELVAVFPEGAKGGDKRYQDRHKLHRFGRGGYVKLALRTGAPVIPVAIVGHDDPPPMLSRVKSLSRWVGAPLFALTSGLPRLGPLGVPPVPGRWRIAIGEPVREIARQDAEALRDEGLVHELNECVRSAIKQLVEQAMPEVS
jgi:1-acyl-sn-glycerol-3-phosphate acyltransferase